MQKIKIYTIVLALCAFVFGLALLIFINSVGPDRLGNIFLFYFLTAGFIFSTSTLAAFYSRKVFGQRELLNQYLRVSGREGIWLTIIFLISLLLLSFNFFSWINASLLVLTFVFLESYLLTKN